MRLVPLLLAAVALAVAGCTSSPSETEEPAPAGAPACPTPTTPQSDPGAHAPVPGPWQDGFEAADQAIDGASTLPRRATDGTWTVADAADAYEGSAVMRGQGDADPGLSSLLFPVAGEPGDLEMSVAFRIGCVEHPHGVGIVLHVADGGADHQIVRYSASESAWDLFTVRAGERIRQDEARVGDSDPAPGDWTVLRVVSSGPRVTAFDGDELVLDYTLRPEDARAGQVGLFLRGNSDADFDAVRITTLGGPGLPG